MTLNVALVYLTLTIVPVATSKVFFFFLLPKDVLPLSGFLLRMSLSETLGNRVAGLVFHA